LPVKGSVGVGRWCKSRVILKEIPMAIIKKKYKEDNGKKYRSCSTDKSVLRIPGVTCLKSFQNN